EAQLLFHAGLTVFDQDGKLVPHLAQKVPSLEDGDWVTLPDDTMRLTWKLRPNTLWHDGSPLLANDFVFGSALQHDPNIVGAVPEAIKLVSGVEAPDPSTVVITWKATYAYANVGSTVMAMPS